METNSIEVMGPPSFLTVPNEFMGMHSELGSGGKTVNFTQKEKQFLVNLIDKRRDILIDKTTFGLTKQYKKEGWDELSVEYNASLPQGHPYRNSKQLRKCWENMKTRFRKVNPHCIDPLSDIISENEQQNDMNDASNLYKVKTSEQFPTLSDVDYHGPVSMVVTSYPSTTDSQPRISSIHSEKERHDDSHDLAAPTADELIMPYEANNFGTEVKSEVVEITDGIEVAPDARSSKFFSDSFTPISSNHTAPDLMVNRNRYRSRGTKHSLVDRNSTRSKIMRKNNSGFRIGSISNRLMGRHSSIHTAPNIRPNANQENSLEAKLTRMRIREADARVQLLKQRMRNESEAHEANLLLLRKKSAFYEAQANMLRDNLRIENHFSSSDEIDEL